VGVKRQWCGQLGKRANCQAGVFLGYASQHGSTLLHRRLYMPKEWLADDYAERRRQCGVPTDLPFQTKPQLGLAMLQQVAAAGTLSFGWLTCDEAFGRDSGFLDAAGQLVSYLAEVPHDTRVWQTRPATAIPAKKPGRGRAPTIERLVPGEPEAQRVDAVAATLPADAWSRQTVKEGSKGPITADFAWLRVVGVREAMPGPDLWLVFRRHIDTGELKAFLSNAPVETPLATFVWLSGMRWPIETCFEDGKQELGLGDYQTRSWTGWHHHMTLCILAHFLLVRLQIRLQDDAPALTLQQTILLLQATLPQPEFDAELALDIVQYRQRRNHAAYRSHRKKRISQSEVSL
jgi:SRSO17 transposase